MAQFTAGRKTVVRGWIWLMIVILVSGETRATSLSIRSVDNSGAPELSGYVTQDLVFSTETDWLSAQLALALDTGAIYQDPRGGIFSPDTNLLVSHPTLEFDTYLSGGSLREGVSVAGGAVDMGYGSEAVFSSEMLSAVWYTTSLDDIGSVDLGRISLSGKATGAWAVRITSSPAEVGPVLSGEGRIAAGVMIAETVTVTERWARGSQNGDASSSVPSSPLPVLMKGIQGVYDQYDEELLEARLRRSAERASADGIRDVWAVRSLADPGLARMQYAEMLARLSSGAIRLGRDVPEPALPPYPYGNAVPEPGAIVLACLGAILLCARKRR